MIFFTLCTRLISLQGDSWPITAASLHKLYTSLARRILFCSFFSLAPICWCNAQITFLFNYSVAVILETSFCGAKGNETVTKGI